MTYCLGIKTRAGLVFASDSRTNAGMDQVNVCRKLHTFVKPGERVLVLLTSGSLSVCQSILTLVRNEFQSGHGLASVDSLYDAARCVGEHVRKVAELDREALERDKIAFNPNLLLGGQVRGEPPDLYLIYPQGNPLRATEDSPYLQIGETKYGRPILDRGLKFHETTLEEAAKYAVISLDSTMRSNVTVGPPVDLLLYPVGSLEIKRQVRLQADDPQLRTIHQLWEQSLRHAVQALPAISFGEEANGQPQSAAPTAIAPR
ncbi:MAG: peptidase [Planctomycetia bacterium]|nr:peptidase [Planctomycetia bacterium]